MHYIPTFSANDTHLLRESKATIVLFQSDIYYCFPLNQATIILGFIVKDVLLFV